MDQILRILDGLQRSVSAPVERVFDDMETFQYDRILVAIVIFLAFLLLRRPLRHLIFVTAGWLIPSKAKDFREKIRTALAGPVELLPVAVGTFLSVRVIRLEEDGAVAQFSDRVVVTLFVVAVYWAMLNLVEPLVEHLRPRASQLTDSVVDWIRKALKCMVAFFAMAAILQHWGVRIGPLLAGMGIAGAAVALGAQALFKNLISGVLILLERRFQYGDWVKVEGVIEGTVESIGFRSTRVRQFDDSTVQVPNSDFADNAVINYSQMRNRRIFWLIGVPYGTTVDQLKEIRNGIEAYIHTSGDFASPAMASTFVRIDSFGASAINIMVYCFTRTTHWGEWLLVKERLAYKIMDIVLGAGSSFAFPSTSVYVESVPKDAPELFFPPEDGRPRTAAVEAPSPVGAPATQPASPS